MRTLLRIFFFSVILAGPVLNAQPGGDRVQALRVAFISKRLELSPSESERFWPVYNEYNDKLQAIRKNLRHMYRKNGAEVSDSEAEEIYRSDLQSRQAEADVHKQYSEKLKTIVGAKKMVRLRLAEEDFKRELIKTIKDQNE